MKSKLNRLLTIVLAFLLLAAIGSYLFTDEKSLSANLLSRNRNEGEKPMLISVSHIWDYAGHNAFTDLIEYQGAFLLTFRESNEHAGGENGSIRILKSEDGKDWKSIAFLSMPGFDLRDPKFAIMPDGRLMLTLGGSIYQNDQHITTHPLVTFSQNGTAWSEIYIIDLPKEWIWRVTWYQDHGYGVSYHAKDPSIPKSPWILTLYQTKDGLQYTRITDLDVPDYPSETTLRFMPDGTMVALVRRQGNGWIGSSSPPYNQWKWSDCGSRLGGPDFLILPNGHMWAASRLIDIKGKEIYTYTALGRMTLSSYIPELILPSSGDTSYPGMVYRNGKLYISYYSSHEGKSNIYFAEVQLPKEQ
jgi:hypothetical protein